MCTVLGIIIIIIIIIIYNNLLNLLKNIFKTILSITIHGEWCLSLFLPEDIKI